LPEPILRIENLEFSFGPTPVLKGVNLELNARENCLLWGFNGSGKTTLGKLVAGLLRPDSGRITVNSPAAGVPVGMVLAEPDLMLLGDTALEDVRVGPENLNFDREDVERRAGEALNDVGLWELRNRPIAELSTGERKRLAVAGVLAMGVEILILDEPFAFMDDFQAERLFDVLRRIAAAGRAVLVLSGHLRWPELYDRVFVLIDGTVNGGKPQDMVKYVTELTSTRLDAAEKREDG
jgi:energy-coupling factor transporter ATP-binding protein EcfA2